MSEESTKAEDDFKKWYYENGANWNAKSIKPVWMAAWKSGNDYHAAKESSRSNPCPYCGTRQGIEGHRQKCGVGNAKKKGGGG